MTKRPSSPVIRQPARLTPDEMMQGVIKLRRRMADLVAFDPSKFDRGNDPSIIALQTSIQTTFSSIFSPESTEYKAYENSWKLDLTFYTMSISVTRAPAPFPVTKIREGLQRGRDRSIALVGQAIKSLSETLDDMGESPSEQSLRAFEGLKLHPEIERAVGELYRNKHYANSIVDAVIALNGLVKTRSGRHDLDGKSLMEHVFSPKKPILKFNELVDQSDKDEQAGLMMMFSGAVLGLRNPRAHKLIDDDPERTLEAIAFVSLLAKLLDGAKKSST